MSRSIINEVKSLLNSKYIQVKQTRQTVIINLLHLNNFYPVISHRRVQERLDNYCIRFWSLVMVRSETGTVNLKGTGVKDSRLKSSRFTKLHPTVSFVHISSPVSLLLLRSTLDRIRTRNDP